MNWLDRGISEKLAASGVIIAYHATTAGSQILQGGFKTRNQLNDKSSLGGGTDNAVSFTTDWAVAKGVFDGLVFASQIANAPNQFNFIQQHFNSLSPIIQQNVTKMLSAIHGGSVSENLNSFLSGFILDGAFGFGKFNKPLTENELNSLGFLPSHKNSNIVNGENVFYNWFRPMNEKEKSDFLYSYLKAYHAGGDVYNPVFFGTNIENFKGIKREDIGIISAEIEIDTNRRGVDDFPREGSDFSHRYVDSMAEIRIYDLNSIKKILDYDSNPGVRPKFKSRNQYYGNKSHFAGAVNLILNFIYDNYHYLSKYFKSKNIAIDSLISMLQRNGENDRNLWTLIKNIQKLLEFKSLDTVNNVLQNHIKMKNLIKVPPEIQKLLNILPEEYRNRILVGERSPEVFSDMYDKNKIAYDTWWNSHHDPYDAEKLLNDWTFDRARNLEIYENFNKSSDFLIKSYCGDFNPELIYGLVQILKEAESIMMKQSDSNFMMLKTSNIFYHNKNLSPDHIPENRRDPNKPITFFIHDGLNMHVIDGIASDSHSSLGFPYIPDAVVYGRGQKWQTATISTDPDMITVELLDKIVGDVYSVLGQVKIKVEYFGNMYSLPDAFEEIKNYGRSAFSKINSYNWLQKTGLTRKLCLKN